METQTEYVVRMLKKPQINVPAVADAVNVSKQNLYNLIKREDGKSKLIESLFDYLKKIGE